MSTASASNFHLITCDQQRIPVDKSLLLAHSTVFRDLFELASATGKEEECEVSETAHEVEMMIRGLNCEQVDFNVDEVALLAKLADKYSSALLAWTAKASCWKLLEAKESLLEVFAISTLLGDRSLTNVAAINVLNSSDRTSPLPPSDTLCQLDWLNRLDRLRLARLEFAIDILRRPLRSVIYYIYGGYSCPGLPVGKHFAPVFKNAMVAEILQRPRWEKGLGEMLMEELRKLREDFGTCVDCGQRLESWVRDMDRKWEESPKTLEL